MTWNEQFYKCNENGSKITWKTNDDAQFYTCNDQPNYYNIEGEINNDSTKYNSTIQKILNPLNSCSKQVNHFAAPDINVNK